MSPSPARRRRLLLWTAVGLVAALLAGASTVVALLAGAATVPSTDRAGATHTAGAAHTATGISQLKLSYPTGDPSTSIAVSWRDAATAASGTLQIVPTTGDFASCSGGAGCRVVTATRKVIRSPDRGPYAYYQAVSTDLRPATAYRYRVLDGTTAGPTSTFTTTASGAAPLRAAFVGEVHIGDQPSPGSSTPALGPTLDRIAASGARFTVSTGDNVNTGSNEAEWERFFAASPASLAKVPYLSAVGNHETYGGFAKGVPSAQFFAGFPQPTNGDGTGQYYSFDADGVHVAVVEANPETAPALYRRELRWLRSDLRAAAKRTRFQVVVDHSPPFHSKTSRVTPTYQNPEYRDGLVPLMDRYGVELVISGHDTHYVRSYPLVGRARPGRVPAVTPKRVRPGRGTTYMELSTSGQSYPDFLQQAWMAKAEPVSAAYLQLDFGAKQITANALRPDGTALDRFVIRQVR